MQSSSSRRALVAGIALVLLGVAAACGDDGTSPVEVVPTDQLGFLRVFADAPPLANPTITFWARRGREEERVVWYRPRPGRTDSTEFLRFRLEEQSLLRRPNGTLIATGDSVLITITVIDAARLVASFQPAGLQFDPERGARLKFKFAETDDDRDSDGDVDGNDGAITAQLAIWRQELAGQPWVRLSSTLEVGNDQVEAELTGFTNYAVAYRARQ